jgi:plasmid stabilization system protein ParE
MRTVVWTESGRADYFMALAFLADDNPDAADRLADHMDRAARALGRIPTGRPGRVEGTYEKSLPRIRYIMVYSLDGPPGVVNILRVIHTSREWNPGTWPG